MCDIVGLMPAAGMARRLGALSQSKEILPVAFGAEGDGNPGIARPACTHLLEGFSIAGAKKAFILIRTGKWDIPETLTQNPVSGVDLSYIVIEESAGVPWSLDRAYTFVRGSNVVMGFPDVLVQPPTFYRQLVETLLAGKSDVVLGVMPTNNPGKVDVVEISECGKVDAIHPKPDDMSINRAWIAASWRPSFTEYLHEYLLSISSDSCTKRELQIGDVLGASLTELDVHAVRCDEGRFIDIGTPEDLASVTTDNHNC